MHPFKHLRTITHHHNLVMLHCFKCGLYWQGLTHDLSKLSPVEFWTGARYYQGSRSPNNAQRETVGYTAAWLHHKGRNRHHLEYWIDYSAGDDSPMTGMRMPERYVAEMVCDRIAACKTYRGKNYDDSAAWDYYLKGRGKYLLHPETQEQLEKCLLLLKDKGEDALFRYIREDMLKNAGKNKNMRT